MIKLQIIGGRTIDKFLLSFNKNIHCLGPKKKLEKFIKGSICGLANLKIATGIQGKVLTYMSYGLPVICTKKVALNFNNSVLSYKNDKEFIDKLKKLKKNIYKINKLKNNSKKLIRNFTKKKINQRYIEIIKANKKLFLNKDIWWCRRCT